VHPVRDVEVLEVLLVQQNQRLAVDAVVLEDLHVLLQPDAPQEQRHLWREQTGISR